MRGKTMKILLALALVLGLCTMTALAADDGITVQVDASAEYDTIPEFADGAVYCSLEDAVAAANAVESLTIKDTIALVSDVTLTDDVTVPCNITIPAEKEITIDLNEQVLNLGSKRITNSGALTITSASTDGKIEGTANQMISNNSTLTLENGSIVSTGYGAVRISTNTEFIMNGGYLEGSVGIQALGGTITINQGTVQSNYGYRNTSYGAIAVTGKDVVMTIGQAEATDDTVLIDGAKAHGLIFKSDENITINCGTISSVSGTFGENPVEKWNCRFKEDISSTLPAGYFCQQVIEDDETYYRIAEMTAEDVAATIQNSAGETVGEYASLVAAIGKLQEGDTLTLTKDYNGSVLPQITATGNITVDLNGYDITGISTNSDRGGLTFWPSTATKVTVKNSAEELSTITGYHGLYATTRSSNQQVELNLAGNLAFVGEEGDSIYLGYAYLPYTEENAALYSNGGFKAVDAEDNAYIYGTFAAAVDKDADKTVELLNNYTGTGSIALAGREGTLDLQGHTFTTKNSQVVYPSAEGTNLTVKNGTLINTGTAVTTGSTNGECGASIMSNNVTLTLEDVSLTAQNDFGIVTHGTVSGVTVNLINSSVTTNGVGIYFPSKDSTLNIENCQITGSTAVGVKGGTVTISGESTVIRGIGEQVIPSEGVSSGITDTGDAIYLEANYGFGAKVIIEDGKFSSANGKAVQMLFKAADGQESIEISGGLFSTDPSQYVVADKMASAESTTIDGITYVYAIGDKVENTATVEAAPDVKVDTTGKEEQVAAAMETVAAALQADDAVKADGLQAVANTITKDETRMAEAQTQAAEQFVEENVDTAGKATTIVIEQYMEIQVTDAVVAGEAVSVTLDIIPKYNLKATTADVAAGEEMIEDGAEKNTVTLDSGLTLTVTTPVDITLPLPAVLADAQADTLYVQHQKSASQVYYYKAIVDGTENKTITFTNPNGFSTFVLKADARQATVDFGESIGEQTYTPAEINSALPTPTEIPSGKRFSGWTFAGISGTYQTLTDDLLSQLAAQEGIIQAAAKFANKGGGSSTTTTYDVTVATATNGNVTVSPNKAAKNDTVTVTVQADTGYQLDQITAVDSNNNGIALAQKTENTYTFQMPAANVEVKATFKTVGTSTWNNPFTDVNSQAWYYEAVQFVCEKGLMNGVTSTTFDPNSNLTRGMIVQVLYNMEGKPAVSGSAFKDVAETDWYADAVVWASQNNIVRGYGDETFGPKDSITRQQMALVLYQYAKLKGYDVTATGDLAAFSDGAKTADWAKEAVQWAVAKQLLSGKGNGVLDPSGTATRAEVAQIFMNFSEQVIK